MVFGRFLLVLDSCLLITFYVDANACCNSKTYMDWVNSQTCVHWLWLSLGLTVLVYTCNNCFVKLNGKNILQFYKHQSLLFWLKWRMTHPCFKVQMKPKQVKSTQWQMTMPFAMITEYKVVLQVIRKIVMMF